MKAMVGLVIAILIIFGMRLFWPSDEFVASEVYQSKASVEHEIEQADADDVVVNETESTLPELDAPSSEEKTKLMSAEYEILQDSRKKLKRHIAFLKHEMWGLKFPSDKAKQISMSVMSASNLLNNPNLLGAFLNVEQIKDEIAKINFAEKSLEEVDEIIKVKLEENASKEVQTNSATQ